MQHGQQNVKTYKITEYSAQASKHVGGSVMYMCVCVWCVRCGVCGRACVHLLVQITDINQV